MPTSRKSVAQPSPPTERMDAMMESCGAKYPGNVLHGGAQGSREVEFSEAKDCSRCASRSVSLFTFAGPLSRPEFGPPFAPPLSFFFTRGLHFVSGKWTHFWVPNFFFLVRETSAQCFSMSLASALVPSLPIYVALL